MPNIFKNNYSCFKIRQLYSNHHIMFLGWNVGCILALKAALVCPVSSIICMSPPFSTLSEESKVEKKKDFFLI